MMNRFLLAAFVVLLLMGCLLIGWVVLSIAHAAPAPLHLEADASRSELVRGDTLAIDAYVFNDGASPESASITILAPAGFELIQATEAGATIAPGRALHAQFRYQVRDDAPKGRARFVVRGGGQTAEVVVRVGPVEWRSVWVPMVRG